MATPQSVYRLATDTTKRKLAEVSLFSARSATAPPAKICCELFFVVGKKGFPADFIEIEVQRLTFALGEWFSCLDFLH